MFKNYVIDLRKFVYWWFIIININFCNQHYTVAHKVEVKFVVIKPIRSAKMIHGLANAF